MGMAAGRFRAVAVVGSGICTPEESRIAEEVGRLLAKRGVAVVCGGLGGVMEAACKGAKSAGGIAIGILPGSDPGAANRFVDIPIATGLGEARNAVVAGCCSAMIAIGGEFGTLSEIAFALKLGRRVVGLGTWDLAQKDAPNPISQATSPEEAVRLAVEGLG